jgi:hypothetical protein
VQRMSRRVRGWSGPGAAEEIEWRDGAEPLVQDFKLWWSSSVLQGQKFQSHPVVPPRRLIVK